LRPRQPLRLSTARALTDPRQGVAPQLIDHGLSPKAVWIDPPMLDLATSVDRIDQLDQPHIARHIRAPSARASGASDARCRRYITGCEYPHLSGKSGDGKGAYRMVRESVACLDLPRRSATTLEGAT